MLSPSSFTKSFVKGSLAPRHDEAGMSRVERDLSVASVGRRSTSGADQSLDRQDVEAGSKCDGQFCFVGSTFGK